MPKQTQGNHTELSGEDKANIRNLYKAIQNEFDGFKPRKEQSYLIAEIAKTLGGNFLVNKDDKRIIVCEAGTGTGKTLAYLIPAIIMARKAKMPLIVSTATVPLQNQLESKDLPLIQKVLKSLNLNLTFKVALGRNRYMCRRDAENIAVTESNELQGIDSKLSADDEHLLDRMITQFDNGKWDGIRDNWTKHGEIINSKVWNSVNCKSGTCTKRICAHYKECAFIKARRDLSTADVIVSNHALTMASVATGNNVLPAPEDAIWCFDEAHHIAKQFRSSFEQKSSLESTIKWLKKAPQSAVKLSMAHGQDVGKDVIKSGTEFREVVESAVTELQTVSELIINNCNFSTDATDATDEQVYRFKDGVLPTILYKSTSNIAQLAKKINRYFNAHIAKLNEGIENNAINTSGNIEKLLTDANRLNQLANSFFDTWNLLLKSDSKGSAIAKWVSCKQSNISVCASPISVANELNDTLWSQAAAVIATSATMTSLGNFNRFTLETGLQANDGTQYRRVNSPFDYQAQAKLIIPSMEVDPTVRNEEAHTLEICHYTEQMGNQHKALLMLFTSMRQMKSYVESVSPEIRAIMLVQGNDTHANLINQHKARIDRGEQSILVGLQSLSEGLDLPKKYLTCVGIAKIPFANYKEPIDEAEGEWIKKRGGNPFMEQSLPEASAKLIQQVGRLIRSTQCSGEVLIFDKRLTSKKYGSQLIQSLPDLTLVA